MTWRGLRKSPSSTSFSPSQSSFAHSAGCEVEEVPRTTTFNVSRPSLPRPSSSRSKGDNQTEKADSIYYHKSFSAMGCPKPPTLWSTNDSYLPRAKPPPPLKGIKHQRNRSEHNKRPANLSTSQLSTSRHKASQQGSVSLSVESLSVPSYSDSPILDISSQHSSMSHRTTPQSAPSSSDLGSRQSSLPHSPILHSAPSSSDLPVLDISREHNDGPAVQPESETRYSIRMSSASEGSNETGISSAPTKLAYGWKWRPPSNWNGPSKPKRVDEEDKPKPTVAWPFSRKGSVDTSSQRGGVQSRRDLNRAQSLRELKPVELANVGKSAAPILGSAPPSSGVTVKIKCFQKRGWEEKPIAEVIPLLRELRVG